MPFYFHFPKNSKSGTTKYIALFENPNSMLVELKKKKKVQCNWSRQYHTLFSTHLTSIRGAEVKLFSVLKISHLLGRLAILSVINGTLLYGKKLGTSVHWHLKSSMGQGNITLSMNLLGHEAVFTKSVSQKAGLPWKELSRGFFFHKRTYLTSTRCTAIFTAERRPAYTATQQLSYDTMHMDSTSFTEIWQLNATMHSLCNWETSDYTLVT